MKLPLLYKWAVIIGLSVLAVLFSQLSLFIPTLSSVEKMHMLIKTGISIVLLFMQWVFVIPMIRMGLTVMNPIQITIFVFVVTFLVQLITNVYVFGNKNTVDDYVASTHLSTRNDTENYKKHKNKRNQDKQPRNARVSILADKVKNPSPEKDVDELDHKQQKEVGNAHMHSSQLEGVHVASEVL